MDEIIIKFYRRLLQEEFPNSGEIQHPSIFIEAVGEKLINCGNTGNYMQLYIQVNNSQITEIKYLCSCEPVANVAVEILCTLITGKSIEAAKKITEEHFIQLLGSADEKFLRKVRGVLQLLRDALEDASEQQNREMTILQAERGEKEKFSWDGSLST